MKVLVSLIASALCVLGAQAQNLECIQTDFSGEATQSQPFRKELGDGFTFSVEPVKVNGDPSKALFQIIVLGKDASAFIFNPSDRNWALAANDSWSGLIGGLGVDLHAALGYRSRYLLLPLSVEQKQKAREAAHLVWEARTPEAERKAIAALSHVRMAHALFEITDYALGGGAPPTSVESVSFRVKLTFPDDFLISGELPVTVVNCPAIPTEAIANIKDPHRHEHLLSRKRESPDSR